MQNSPFLELCASHWKQHSFVDIRCYSLCRSWLQHMKELNLALVRTFWWKQSQNQQVQSLLFLLSGSFNVWVKACPFSFQRLPPLFLRSSLSWSSLSYQVPSCPIQSHAISSHPILFYTTLTTNPFLSHPIWSLAINDFLSPHPANPFPSHSSIPSTHLPFLFFPLLMSTDLVLSHCNSNYLVSFHIFLS